jgi:hypothetical protein
MSPSHSPQRQLGAHGPQVSALGFGVMGLSIGYGTVPSDDERFAILDRAYELGQTFWDTADIYADNEDLIGAWFARTGKREDVFLATKFANYISDGKFITRNDPEYVREACERSLKRLGVEKIDLYYCHRLDGKTPIEKTIRAMVELKKYVFIVTYLPWCFHIYQHLPTDGRPQRRQNHPPRPIRNLRLHPPPRPRRPPHHRRPNRILPLHHGH